MANPRSTWFAWVLCSLVFAKHIDAQGMYFRQSNVNAYKMVNGQYQIIPSTTPEPSLLETIFPWMGNSYQSAKSPAEDAEILNSLSDNDASASSNTPAVTESEGLLSWLSLPSFGSSSSESTSAPEEVSKYPSTQSSDNDNAIVGQINVAASNSQPIVVAPDNAVPDNSFGMGSQMYAVPAQQQYPSPPAQYHMLPPQNSIHHEMMSVNPTFQFHHQMQDSIITPVLAQPILGVAAFANPPIYPYPYSIPMSMGQPPTSSPAPEKSLMDTIADYFSFGKRSDNAPLARSLPPSSQAIQMKAQAKSDGASSYSSDDSDSDSDSSSDQNDDASGDTSSSDASSASSPSSSSAKANSFPCPKTGLWRWNSEVCIAVGPTPVWACRPNDLIVSGKIAICRNKIYFSPTILSKKSNKISKAH